MGNSYFQFKKFIIYQDKCAMKVCTDACILGAYLSSREQNNCTDGSNILDIGAGTGLLSLMVAQKVKGNIEAVEVDDKAFEQAQQNFKNSLWQSRLSVLHADITDLILQKKYRIIVSNPPFFEKSLKSPIHQNNLAKHSSSLSYTHLAKIVSTTLLPHGKFYILLPVKEFNTFCLIAMKNYLNLIEEISIRQHNQSNVFRKIGVFALKPLQPIIIKSLAIKEDEKYSPDFTNLLNDYYLSF